ncbi:MAG: hypothetical protein NC218_12490 [Acetobacter sp.]|nr:hypothetical protein [Acetobacter sp.]
MKYLEKLNTIQNIKINIDDITRQAILDKLDARHTLSQKIANTTLVLYLNAYRLSKGAKPLLTIKEENLTLDKIENIMMEIYHIVSSPLFIQEVEEKIQKLIQNYFLNLDELWVANQSDDKESIRLKSILDGNYNFLS